MARVLTYNRPVDVISDSVDCGSSWSGALLKVKKEVDDSKEPIDEFPTEKSTSVVCNDSTNLSEEACRSNENSRVRDSYLRKILQRLYKKCPSYISRERNTTHSSRGTKGKHRKIHKAYMRQLSAIVGDLKNSSTPECYICFLKIDSLSRLSYHYRHYMTATQYVCSFCNLKLGARRLLNTHLRTTHNAVTSINRFNCECNFCGQKFILKDSLQAHLFHFHSDSIYFRTETPVQLNQSDKITDQTNSSKPDLMLQKERNCKYSPVKEHLPTEQCVKPEIDNHIEPSIGNKHTPKKMRQTTLTEFINFSSPRKRESISIDKTGIKEIGKKNLKLSPEMSNKPSNSNKLPEFKPFVQIHLPPEEYLGQSPGKTPQKEITNGSGKWVRRSTRFSMRLSNSYNQGDDPFNCANMSSSRQSLELNKTASYTQSLSNTDSELARKYNCKKCSVSLVRCDAKFNNMPKTESKDEVVPVKKQKRSNLPKLSKGGSLMLNELKVSLERLPLEKIVKTSETSEPVTNNQDVRKETFICKVCEETFSLKEEKKQHMKATHTAYMSSICNARYTFKHKLIEHYLRQHYLFKRNECCVCGEPCSDRIALRRHLLLHCIKIIQSKHDTTPVDVEVTCKSYHKTNKCLGCGKTFWLYSCLQQHLMNCQKWKRIDNNESDGHVTKSKFPTIQLHDKRKEPEVINMTSSPSDLLSNKNLTETAASTDQIRRSQITSTSPSETNKQNMDPKILQTQNVQSTFLADSVQSDMEPEVIDITTSARHSSNNKNLPANDVSTDTEIRKTQISSASPSDINKKNTNSNVCQTQNAQSTLLEDSMRFTDTNSTLPSSSTTKVNDAKTKYYCDICGRQYQTYKNLQQHLRMFKNLVGEPCNICGTVFGSMRLLRAHFSAAHVPEIVQSYNYHCTFCNQGFCKKDSLRIHELHLHSTQLMPVNVDKRANVGTACNVCNLVFECHDRFEEHNMYYDKHLIFSCGFCGQFFRGMYMLHHHNKLVHYAQFTTTSYNYTCGTCGEGFNHETHFYAHKVHVHSVNPLSPDLFTKTSSDKRSTIATETADSDKVDSTVKSIEPAYICNVCDICFNNSKELAYHESQFSNDGSYLCDKCSKRFQSLVFLTKHQVLTHSSYEVVNEFVCSICKEVLTSKVSLTCHEKHFHRNRDNTSPSDPTNADCDQTSNKKCSSCDTEFKTTKDLMDHVLQYANCGNFNCDVCHKKFYYLTHLEEHKTTHLAPNLVSSDSRCYTCEEGFTSIAAAKEHINCLHKHKSASTAGNIKVVNAVNNKNPNNNDLDNSTKNTRIPEVNKATDNEVENEGTLASTISSGQPPRSEVSENISDDNRKTQATAKDSLIPDSEDNVQEAKCDICNLKFVTKKNLYYHCQRFKNKGEYVCEFCGGKFNWESLFSDHHRKHIYEMTGIPLQHSCQICKEKFCNAATAHAHIAHCHYSRLQSLEGNWKHKLQSLEKQLGPHQRYFQSKSGEIQIIDITNNCIKNTVDKFIEGTDSSKSSESDEVNIIDDLSDQTDATNVSKENPKNQAQNTTTDSSDEVKIVHEIFPSADNYTCPVCLNTFASLSNFQSHFREMHSQISSEYRSRNHSTQLLKVKPGSQDIACVICNAVFSNPVGFKKHLNTVHMPRMNVLDNLQKRSVKIVKKIPLVPQTRPASTVDPVASDHEKTRGCSSVGESHTNILDTSKKLSVTKCSDVKQDNSNVGKLKVKDFAKLIDQQHDVPKSQVNKKIASAPTEKYVILEPETRSEIYFASYINNLSKNDAQKL